MKLVFFILIPFIIFFPDHSFACRCDFELLNKVIAEPKMAAGAFIGLYNSGYLEVLKNWKPVPSLRIKTESSSSGYVTKCDIQLISDQKYLFLSTEKINSPLRLNLCTTKVMKIEDSQAIISKLEKSF